MTEYIIVVGLIAFGLVTAVKVFSWRLEDAYFSVSIEIVEIGETIDAVR